MMSSHVVQPGEGESYWQPKPASGFVEVALAQRAEHAANFDVGIQHVAPGGRVRLHAHESNEELILVLEGRGIAIVDDREHVMQPGTVLHLAPGSTHQFDNHDDTHALRFYFVMLPGGLRDFFAAIGRPRVAGEKAPPPFERPADVAAIEKRTVFADI